MSANGVKVSEAFSKQSAVFDGLYRENRLSEYLRAQFRNEIIQHLKPQSRILELNCGTGMDALWLAQRGHHILATDNAQGMIDRLTEKLESTATEGRIEAQRLSYHQLDRLPAGQKFDHIISNFGGLNCTDDLADVLRQFSGLLNEGGKVTLMIMPRVCPWELLMAFKGKFRTAFRRFRKKTPAHIEGVHFLCYYYNPRYVIKSLQHDFKVVTLKGVFITVPPEFYQNFVERYPRLFRLLSSIDAKISRLYPFTQWCDHYLITLEKTTT